MINPNNVFDLWDIFVNELIGSVGLTIILGLIVIWFIGVKLRMPFEVQFMFGLIFLSIIYTESRIFLIWVFVVLIIGLLFYYAVNKAMKR